MSIGIQKKASLKPYNEKNTDLQKQVEKEDNKIKRQNAKLRKKCCIL